MFIIWGFIEHEIVPPAVTVGVVLALLVSNLTFMEEGISMSKVIEKLFKYTSSLGPGKEVAGPHVVKPSEEVTHELVGLQNNPLAEGLNNAIS